ncbi:MAG: hypothetical protein HKO66_12520, partial [Saprospiraceae bacterium]|nr:hypothetical protein [Bacteroidia bacterium]NNL93054.1 hypothetical protein [Saprospiraceae bacterium]
IDVNPKHGSEAEVSYSDIPSSMNTAKDFSAIEKEFSNYLYQNKRSYLLEHPDLDIFQKQGESDEAFNLRIQVAATEERNEEIDKLRDKYDSKFDKIEDKIRKEERDMAEAEAEVKSRRTDEIVNIAETIFSVLGGKRSRSLTTAASRRRMSRRAAEDVEESKEEIEELEFDFENLKKELQEKVDDIKSTWDSAMENVIKKEIKPRRTDVKVDNAIFVWYPS